MHTGLAASTRALDLRSCEASSAHLGQQFDRKPASRNASVQPCLALPASNSIARRRSVSDCWATHNRRLFAAVDLAPVDHLADIEAVLEQMGERPHAKAPPADGPAVRQPPRLAANSPAIEILRQRADGAKLEIAGKDRADRRSLGCDHNDLPVH